MIDIMRGLTCTLVVLGFWIMFLELMSRKIGGETKKIERKTLRADLTVGQYWYLRS